jgi:hypothetical protein
MERAGEEGLRWLALGLSDEGTDSGNDAAEEEQNEWQGHSSVGAPHFVHAVYLGKVDE